jgi:hypothetical protein
VEGLVICDMGPVTNVYWECPGCYNKNNAQIYGEWEDPDEFPIDKVPISRGLKWNPPCELCGKYQLENAPEIYT